MTFHVHGGTPVPFEVLAATIDGGAASITARADAGAWATIEDGLLFNLDRTTEGGDALPPQLATDTSVTFSARLDDSLVAGVKGDLAKRLAGEDADSPLLDTERWFLTEAHEDSGDGGYRTVFADADHVAYAKPDFDVTVTTYDEEAVDEEPPGPLMAQARAFMDVAGLPYDDLGPTVIGGIQEGANGSVHLIVHAREQHGQLLVYGRCPDDLPAERRGELMELVTRINVDLPGAWLELDLDALRISARTAVNARGALSTDAVLSENAIAIALQTMDEFLPAIRAVAFEGIDVADILAADAT